MGAETPAPSASAPVKGKGKARQLAKAEQIQREPSMDSVSAPPTKGRKKPGPKKKLGLAPEIESEIAAAASSALSVGGTPAGTSYPPSLSGDATPNISRPTSPAPANMSTVYDLDEEIPPLKKAKKIDDTAMVKRIKTLEEAQKKVWTNIARREVAKVSVRYSGLSPSKTNISSGVQVSCAWVPDPSVPVGTYGQIGIHSGSQAIHEDHQGQ
jgi:DNA helicase INO80